MILEITTAVGCPVSCGYCPQAALMRAYTGPRLMTLEVFESALRNIPESAEIHFAGFCEPFVNNLTASLIAMVSGRVWKIFTTGVGMTLEDAEAVRAARPRAVVVHYQSRVKPNIAALERVLGSCDAPRILVERGSDVPKRWTWPVETLRPHTRAGNCGAAPERKRGPLTCRPAPHLDHPVMMPDGRLVLCCQDYQMRHVIGDITKDCWNTIAAGPAMAAIRAAMVDGDCLCNLCEFSVCGSC